jgi:hypothetical protein
MNDPAPGSITQPSIVMTDTNQDLEGVNLSDPEEIEAHLQVLDVRARLRQRRKRMMQLFSVAFLGVAVFLFIRLEFFGNPNNDGEDTFDDGSLASTNSGADLRQPPADLASKCSLSTLNAPQGVEICEEACEVSECCNVPDGFAFSCKVHNEVVCAQYQRYCDILHNLPEDLARPPDAPVASPVLQQQPVGGDGGGGTEELKVQIDGACLNIPDSSLPDSPCMSLCQDGFCCFGNYNTCGSTNVNCQLYLNCNQAFLAAQPPTPLTVREEIEQACDNMVETVSAPGENTCENLCASSFCCFNHLCVAPADVDCLEFSACHILFDDVDTVDDDQNLEDKPTLEEEIASSCGYANIAIAATECEALCGLGACCFMEQLVCPVDTDCAAFAGCEMLYPDNESTDVVTPSPVTAPPVAAPISAPISEGGGGEVAAPTATGSSSITQAEVDDACNNHNDNALVRPTLCEQVCTLQVLQCCFHFNGGDACPTIPCEVYAACEALDSSPEMLREIHKLELETACGEDAGRAHCVQLCAAATCCYAMTIEEECVNADASITCPDYQACNILFQGGSSEGSSGRE